MKLEGFHIIPPKIDASRIFECRRGAIPLLQLTTGMIFQETLFLSQKNKNKNEEKKRKSSLQKPPRLNSATGVTDIDEIRKKQGEKKEKMAAEERILIPRFEEHPCPDNISSM